MARSPKPMPLWLPIVAAVCLAIAAVLQRETFSQVLMGLAAACFVAVAVMQWRMRRRSE